MSVESVASVISPAIVEVSLYVENDGDPEYQLEVAVDAFQEVDAYV